MPLTWTDNRVLSGQELSRLAAAIAGTYVVPTASGGAVTTSAAMTVAVAAITTTTGLYVNGTQDTTGYAGGTTVIATADPALPRRDYVWYDGAGGIGNTTGVAAANPVLPDLTSGRIALAEIYVTAGLTTIASGNIIDRRANLLSVLSLGGIINKYKAAIQTISASTAFADVSAAGSSTFAFTPGASEVWLVDILLNMTFTSTGGFKLQFTGPASPTRVDINTLLPLQVTDAAGANSFVTQKYPLTVEANLSTAFSATFAAHAATTTSGASGTYDTNGPGLGTASWPLRITALIANGSTSSAVTLQAAQNSGAGTAVIGIGSWMTARRIA